MNTAFKGLSRLPFIAVIKANCLRYISVQWATKALDAVDVVVPGSAIVHDLNVESTLHVVCCNEDGLLYPDTVIGTDSHTAVNNGLGIFSIG